MARSLPTTGSNDLIVACATGNAPAAVAIVRLSGPGAQSLQERIFKTKKNLSDIGRLVLGEMIDPENEHRIDSALTVRWQGPHSFTGEDVVEFHLHGSQHIVREVTELCCRQGARPAMPGEFTRRAFLNGKIDLARAEAISALVQAGAEVGHRAALAQLRGDLSNKLNGVRARLVNLLAEIEVGIDYPDEDLEQSRLSTRLDILATAAGEFQALIDSHRRGRVAVEGARVVLAGLPNAGKSSLFNALIGRERAIVSPHAGTTRDSIEATIDIQGMPITLVDTAGLRETIEEIEALGIERSKSEIASAAAVVFIVDPTADIDEQRRLALSLPTPPTLIAINKADMAKDALSIQIDAPKVSISCKSRQGLEELERVLIGILVGEQAGNGLLLSSERHREALTRAVQNLQSAFKAFAELNAPELAALDIQNSINEIDAITGRSQLDEEVLNTIFSKFCLGK